MAEREFNSAAGEVCICCGTSRHITFDHYLPQCMVGTRTQRLENPEDARRHPLYPVVFQPDNLFPICKDDHNQVDNIKVPAFLGEAVKCATDEDKDAYKRGDPVALLETLVEIYPITTNRRLFPRQIEGMVRTNRRFIRTVHRLGSSPDFDWRLRQRYQEASLWAEEYNKHLRELPEPPSFYFMDWAASLTTPSSELYVPSRVIVDK